VYLEPASSQSAALKREAAIKRLSKAAKEKLIKAPRRSER
jgi:predicted GIY-YIG superfamily endonuclease